MSTVHGGSEIKYPVVCTRKIHRFSILKDKRMIPHYSSASAVRGHLTAIMLYKHFRSPDILVP